jgi:chemotaxis signal transduction protein
MNEPEPAEKHGQPPREDRDRTLIFRLGKQRFGLPLAMVVEVFELASPLSPVPGAPPWIGGMLNHHGRVIPVLRMSRFMEVGATDSAGQIILVDLSGESLGLAVDQIESLEEVRAEGPAQAGRRRSWHRGALMELIDAEFIQGTIKQRLAGIGPAPII